MLFASPDLATVGVDVVAGAAGVVGAVDGVVEEVTGVPKGGIAGVVEDGVPAGTAGAVVVVPSAAGVVEVGSGFLNGSSHVCRT